MNHDIYNYTPRCNWFHCKCKEQNQSFILTLRWVRGCVVARVSASDIYPSQPARPPKPRSALHYKDLQLYLKLCKLLAWIKPSEQKLSPMEKFIEIVDTFFFNLRSTSPNLIALGIAMAGWNFMHLRCTDQGMMDLQVWTIRSGGASVYLEALGKQRSTQLNSGQPTIIQHLHSLLYSHLPTTNESICLFVQGTLCKIMLVGNWDGSVAVCVNYAQFFDETRRAPKNLVSCQGNREILHRNVLQTIVRYAQDRLAPIPNARFAYLNPNIIQDWLKR